MEQDKTEFNATGIIERIQIGRTNRSTHIRLSNIGPKVTSYYECVAFYAVQGHQVGDRVRVIGRLGTKKHDGCRQRNERTGKEYDIWMTELVVEKVEMISQAAPAQSPGYVPPPDDNIPF